MQRRLAVILAADVVGYSRLIERDEAGTIARLKSDRQSLIDPAIAAHSGHIVRLAGDGALVEFPSVVEAIQCAIEIQRGMAARNSERDEHERIVFRMGVNTGDIVIDDDNLHGEGINVAARLESICEPGGILLSEQAVGYVKGKIAAGLEFVEEREVKNIEQPVRIWRVRLDISSQPISKASKSQRRRWSKGAAIVFGAVVTLIAVALLWYQPWQTYPVHRDALQKPSAVPAKPTIAVLPFDNFGGDERTDRLADGLTEDIITDLTRFPEFGVIARNSTERYKDRPADPREVGETLGVEYLLEGSIQHEADRLRITAQLVETGAGRHLWSERWDRPATDLFAVQTEIAEYVANQLGGGAGVIQETGRTVARRKRPSDLNAYEFYLLGTEHLEQITRQDIDEAIRLLTRAVELDPGLARAWVELYHAHNLSRYYGTDKNQAVAAAMEAAKRAVTLDPSDAEAHAAMGAALASEGEFIRAKASFDTAPHLAPNAFEILAFYAGWANTFGEPERGVELATRAIRLNPNFPMWASSPFAWVFFHADRYQDALHMLDRQSPDNYTTWRWAARAGAFAALGHSEQAEMSVQQAVGRFPDISIEGIIDDPGLSPSERQRFIDKLRLAGFPPCAPPEERTTLIDSARLSECENSNAKRQ